jgi:hypothetical protein
MIMMIMRPSLFAMVMRMMMLVVRRRDGRKR